MLGLPESLVYYSARDPGRAGRYLGSAMLMAAMASLPFMAIGYLAIPLLLSAQSAQVIDAARWYLLVVPIFALVSMQYHPLQGRNDWIVWNILRVSATGLWLVILIVAWLLHHPKAQFIAAGYLTILSLFFFPAISIVVARRVPGSFLPDVHNLMPLVRYGLPSMASSIPRMLSGRLDQMVIAAFLPVEMLGIYAVAVVWGSAAHPLLQAIGKVLVPRVASEQTIEQQVQTFARGVRLSVLVAIGIAILLAGLTPWSIPVLFGKPFGSSVSLALVLVLAGTISGLNSVIEEGFRGLGYPAAVLWAQLGGLAATAASLGLFIKPLGVIGAALASLIGYATVSMLLAVQGRWITGYGIGVLFCPKRYELDSAWKHLRVLVEEATTR
jgi:O-antigen/teichoic acid export membrane protein